MVLIRGLVILVACAGCGESLFDNRGPLDGGGGGGGDGQVPVTCPAPCLGDAAGEFPGGAPWRYLEDNRDRTWTAMTAGADTATGTDPANLITTCAAQPGAPACTAVPGALLVSSAGATSAADPAIEFTQTTAQVIQLSARIHVPGGSPNQLVRIYRNSREDLLFSGVAAAGVTLEQAITVDALAGDRFLLALAPAATGAADVAVHLFVNPTGEAFPAQCQLATSFTAATGNTIPNECGTDALTFNDYDTGAGTPLLGAGPFAEHGMAADLVENKYYQAASPLVYGGDFTIQMWVKQDAVIAGGDAWMFSDLDLNTRGGIGLVVFDNGGPKLEVTTCLDCTGDPLIFDGAITPYPADNGWHFIRAVNTGGQISLCIDGDKKVSFATPATALSSAFSPRLGRNVVWTPAGAFVDGGIDDVRVLSTALPCD